MDDRAIGEPEVGPKTLMTGFCVNKVFLGGPNCRLKRKTHHKTDIMQDIYWWVGHAKMAISVDEGSDRPGCDGGLYAV